MNVCSGSRVLSRSFLLSRSSKPASLPGVILAAHTQKPWLTCLWRRRGWGKGSDTLLLLLPWMTTRVLTCEAMQLAPYMSDEEEENCTSRARSNGVMRMRWRKRILACMRWWWALFEHCDKVRVVIVYTLSLHAYDLSLALILLPVAVRIRVGAEAREETEEEKRWEILRFHSMRAHLCGDKWSLAEVRKICTASPFTQIKPGTKKASNPWASIKTLRQLYTICPAQISPDKIVCKLGTRYGDFISTTS